MSLDHQATRWLARRAFLAGALSPTDLDFIDEEPERADEVAEFAAWLDASGEDGIACRRCNDDGCPACCRRRRTPAPKTADPDINF